MTSEYNLNYRSLYLVNNIFRPATSRFQQCEGELWDVRKFAAASGGLRVMSPTHVDMSPQLGSDMTSFFTAPLLKFLALFNCLARPLHLLLRLFVLCFTKRRQTSL